MTDSLERIRALYFAATPRTIARDLAQAIELLKAMPAEQRQRAAVYMDGLAQMRSEWSGGRSKERSTAGPPPARTGGVEAANQASQSVSPTRRPRRRVPTE